MDSTQSSERGAINRKAFIFIFVTAFLSTMGIGLISPVAPYIVGRYVPDPNALGMTLGWLASAYAICQFIAAPGLGALSDRYGRRPILLICLLGSAIGYLLMGLGGALWMLFLGRIIDGITGGNISVTFAYIADITPPGQRGKYFGMVGAIAGIGFILGPAIGGLVAKLGFYEAPLYLAAAVTLANVIFGLFFMPESLQPAQRTTSITLARLNPLTALWQVFAIPQIRWLLVAMLLYSLPFAVLQSNLTLFGKDVLHWDADTAGGVFALVGVTDIIVQGLILQRLLTRFGEAKVAMAGLVCEIIGYLLIASVTITLSPIPIFIGVMVFAMGDGLLGPALGGMISRGAGQSSQGLVQGGGQAVQALARITGPLAGGEIYDRMGKAAPYLGGAAIVLLAIAAIGAALPTLPPEATSTEEAVSAA